MVYFNYVVENYEMILELIGLLVVLGISVHVSERIKRLTLAVVILMFVESGCFHVERWTQGFEQLSLLRPMLTASIYSLYPVILVLIMQITVSEPLPARTLLRLLIPELVSVPLYFTSQWTHLIFWYRPDNHYVGGPGLMSLWPYAIFFLYSLLFLLHNLRFFKSYSGKSRLSSVFIVCAPLLGVLYYKLYSIDKDYSALFTAALLLYYIFVYIHMSKIDPLTALLNRQSYYQDVQLGAKTITGVVSVDMNELKYLNDNFGHEAGDTALKTISAVLLQDHGRGGVPYRIGGDEFMILYSGVSRPEIAASVEQMRRKLAETPYTCAFGLAMVKPGGTIHEALVEADAEMYADKAALKAERLAQGRPLHMRD